MFIAAITRHIAVDLFMLALGNLNHYLKNEKEKSFKPHMKLSLITTRAAAKNASMKKLFIFVL